MTLATSCQHTLLILERLFPSNSRIPAILFSHPSSQAPTPGKGLGRCHSAAAAWRLERQRLTLALHPNAWGTREFPAGGSTALPGQGARPSPGTEEAASRPSGHADKETGPEHATKRGGAAAIPAPRARGARPGRRLHPLPSAEQSAAARPRPGPRPPYLVPLSADGAEHIGSLQNAGEEDSQAQPRLTGKGQRRSGGSGGRGAAGGRRREQSGEARPGHGSCGHTHGAASRTLRLREGGGERGGEGRWAALGRPRSAPFGCETSPAAPPSAAPPPQGRGREAPCPWGPGRRRWSGRGRRARSCRYRLLPRAVLAALSHEHDWFRTLCFSNLALPVLPRRHDTPSGMRSALS